MPFRADVVDPSDDVELDESEDELSTIRATRRTRSESSEPPMRRQRLRVTRQTSNQDGLDRGRITSDSGASAKSDNTEAEDEAETSMPRGNKRKLMDPSLPRHPSKPNLNAYRILKDAQIRESTDREVVVRLPPHLYPETSFCHARRDDEMTEVLALKSLLTFSDNHKDPGLMEDEAGDILLDDFCVYWQFRDTRGHNLEIPEFVSLQDIFLHPTKKFFFDGHLRYNGRKAFVRNVPGELVTIGAMEDLQLHTVEDQLWISTPESLQRGAHYRLGKALPSYRRFHEPYVWAATLTKHVADFLHNHKQIGIHHFRMDFHKWLMKHHGHDHSFRQWLSDFGDTDFRRAIACHTDLLRSQVQTFGGEYLKHRLWDELVCRHIPHHPLPAGEIPKTVVTPYVYKCFKDMFFGHMIQKPSKSQLTSREFPSPWPQAFARTTRSVKSVQGFEGKVRPGDVVAILPDGKDVTSWKSDKAEHWYLYVQGIKEKETGRQLRCLWLYAPSQTTLNNATYLHNDELFLSNHQDDIAESDVTELISVAFFSSGSTESSQFFVRQRYDTMNASFRTLRQADLRHAIVREPRQEYAEGDTVLVRGLENLLEPVVLTEPTSGKSRIRARRLLRARKFDSTASANEVLYSDTIVNVSYGSIEQRCLVRYFHPRASISGPYSGDGAGNCFHVKNGLQDDLIKALSSAPADLIQGFDPLQPVPGILNGLDLFCGCGTFGHSVAEAAAVRTKWAVDIDEQALHSFYANTNEPDQVELYCGSVDKYLSKALAGKRPAPERGSVHFIIAGSPCQGFSNMNNSKDSPRSLKNISLVASTSAYVDFYKPKYVLLENVVALACTNAKTNQNVFSQCLATFVGLGYQVQCFNLDACVGGAPQSRSRLVIALTAPGLSRLDLGLSHCYPEGTAGRSLGKAPNGLPFGERDLEATRAFDYTTISQACSDLPANYDGKAPCVPFPDHRPPRYDPYLVRLSLSCIPRGLPGRHSSASAFAQGLVPQYLADAQPQSWKLLWVKGQKSKLFSRINAGKIGPTILATYSPADRFNGQMIHWEEDRPLTLEEARRAQQFPRQMVLLGTPLQRWHQVGNSVPRGLSLALGVALRIAVENDLANGHEPRDIHQLQTASKQLEPKVLIPGRAAVKQPTEHRIDRETASRCPSVELGEEIFSSSAAPNDSPEGHARKNTGDDKPNRHSTPAGSSQTIGQIQSRKKSVIRTLTRNIRVSKPVNESDNDVIYVSTRATPAKPVLTTKQVPPARRPNRAVSELNSNSDIMDWDQEAESTPDTGLSTPVDTKRKAQVASSRFKVGTSLPARSQFPGVGASAIGTSTARDEPEDASDDDELMINEFQNTRWAAEDVDML